MKTYSIGCLLAVFSLVFALPAAAQQTGIDYSARGPYAVGTREFQIQADARLLHGTCCGYPPRPEWFSLT